MKTFKTSLLAIITVCLTFSCSSDDDVKSNSELIIGTWELTAFSENDVAETLTECELSYTFTETQATSIKYNSGSAPCEVSNTYTHAYSIDNNIITIVGDDLPLEIVTLNSTTMVLKSVEVDSNNTYVYIGTFTKKE
ncbi:lipocalin family protein [Flavivirga aquimarina]|uniref:Lipocalin family protein n=1 Tax=Flavivirga aquimarina TaxID=2027862 RepID=A0ABT8WDW6_9FLAO|nr:lipocalin family protein [Flavivirga aquimarina]MDO5971202.1 lipocalin family protein [Flavivirga aquimarina]